MNKIAVNLGTIQKTLLITLWARAIKANKSKYHSPQRQWAIKNIREIQTWDSP
ncbi:MAG: hypothetical protein ACRC2S_13160 [Waterburya sp.]